MGLTFLELYDISERNIELINPTSPQKILKIGRLAGMQPGKALIDFGCGYAEPLVLWAEEFGVSGIGIELRARAIERARFKIAQRGLSERIKVVQGRGAEYVFPPGSFDFAACIGASFVWDGLPQALGALKEAIHPDGRIIIGEPYWLKDSVPPDFAQSQTAFHSEEYFLQMARKTGLEVEYALHSSLDEWDNYAASNWYGLIEWIKENPNHPGLPDVVQRLHESQDEYFRFGREYFGWALYLLSPVKY